MTYFASKRSHTNVRQFVEQARSVERGLLELESAGDVSALVRWREDWRDNVNKFRPAELECEDLLALAIIQRLPLAFDVWRTHGEIANADTLLALFSDTQSGHFVFEKWPQRGACLTHPRLSPWYGSLFSFLAFTDQQALCVDVINRNLVSVDTPTPVSLQAASEWLWTTDPVVRNELDATLPLHLAIGLGRWSLADDLVKRGASLIKPDGRGAMLEDEIERYLDIHAKSFAKKSEVARGLAWQARIASAMQHSDLEQQTPEAGGEKATSSKRL
jgi:hypothetical protein